MDDRPHDERVFPLPATVARDESQMQPMPDNLLGDMPDDSTPEEPEVSPTEPELGETTPQRDVGVSEPPATWGARHDTPVEIADGLGSYADSAEPPQRSSDSPMPMPVPAGTLYPPLPGAPAFDDAPTLASGYGGHAAAVAYDSVPTSPPLLDGHTNVPDTDGGRGVTSMPFTWARVPRIDPSTFSTLSSFDRSSVRDLLARPFPAWLTWLLPAALLLLLALVYSIAEVAAHADWADGAAAAAYTGFALAAGTLVLLVVRWGLGQRMLSTLLLGAVLVVALAGGGVTALAQAPALRASQARDLERNGQWAGAIQEYILSGESGPAARDVARNYNEWGNASLAAHDYAGAADHYNSVLQDYAQTGSEADRALGGLYQTYQQWLQTGGSDVPYDTVISFLDDYAKGSACDTACHDRVATLEAQAHYQYGVLLADTRLARYADAVTQLEIVQKQFPTSSFAPKAHAAAAIADLALGQQQLKQDCASAIPTYQKLDDTYLDTPEGKKADDALKTPQTVTGQITHVPTNPVPTIFLSRTANINIPSFSNDYHTTIDPSTGVYTFKDIPPGDYYLSTMRDLGAAGTVVTWPEQNGTAALFHVTALCPTTLPTISVPQ